MPRSRICAGLPWTSNASWFGALVPPLQAGPGADHADLLAVHRARVDAHWTRPGPTAPLSYSISVKALSSSGARLLTKLWRVQSRRLILSSRQHHLGQVERMGADIAQHVARARHPGIDTPLSRRIGRFDRFVVEAVRELHLHDADLA